MRLFDNQFPAYRDAVALAARLADSNDALFERAFGICTGMATMLIPGVMETGHAPPSPVADLVCELVTQDIVEATVNQ